MVRNNFALKEYLKNVYKLEENLYTQDNAIRSLNNQIASLCHPQKFKPIQDVIN